jgi:protocatechuate 3,4-dioxygenase beta subunit
LQSQEFILLSDTLGLSLLVDAMDHPKPVNGTEGTVLGPFHTHTMPERSNGDLIMQNDPDGTPVLVVCKIRDLQGRPIEGVRVEIWETDSTGHYDVQRPGSSAPDGRCFLTSDCEGLFWFKAVVPVSYAIPHDGPVGQMLETLGRHPWRPAHLHFILERPGYDRLITSVTPLSLFLVPFPEWLTDMVQIQNK